MVFRREIECDEPGSLDAKWADLKRDFSGPGQIAGDRELLHSGRGIGVFQRGPRSMLELGAWSVRATRQSDHRIVIAGEVRGVAGAAVSMAVGLAFICVFLVPAVLGMLRRSQALMPGQWAMLVGLLGFVAILGVLFGVVVPVRIGLRVWCVRKMCEALAMQISN